MKKNTFVSIRTFPIVIFTLLLSCGSSGEKIAQLNSACGGVEGIQCVSDAYCEYPEGICSSVESEGVCKSKPEMCALVYAPVCGCDGKTYSNSCAAASKGVNVKAKGECPSAQ